MRNEVPIWTPTPGGVLVPTGKSTELNTYASSNYAHVKGRALDIRALFASSGVPLPKTSSLFKMTERACQLSDSWLMDQMEDKSAIDVFYSIMLDRIAAAILPLAECANKKKYLRALASGELDFFARVSSAAKDILWEVELWSLLRRGKGKAKVDLVDPPDLIFEAVGRPLGIACKKIYSESNLEKTLSGAVRQVKGFDAGVAALNIDELTPEGQIFAGTRQEVDAQMRRMVEDFLMRHQRLFRKYLSVGRLVSVWVSICSVVDVRDGEVRFNNYRQSTAWTIPGLSVEKQEMVDALYGSV